MIVKTEHLLSVLFIAILFAIGLMFGNHFELPGLLVVNVIGSSINDFKSLKKSKKEK